MGKLGTLKYQPTLHDCQLSHWYLGLLSGHADKAQKFKGKSLEIFLFLLSQEEKTDSFDLQFSPEIVRFLSFSVKFAVFGKKYWL